MMLHENVKHAVFQWIDLRLVCIGYLLFGVSIVIIARHRMTTDPVTLVMLLRMTECIDDLAPTIEMVNVFKRNCTEAQRVFNLQDAPQELLEGQSSTPADWPSEGKLEFKEVTLRYRPNCERVLNGISFKISAGERVGVVGRTGAGKSTLFMALSRIVELESGTIKIDEQDISKLDLKAVRDQITMIPQDPTLFTGSLRFNLDPFDQHPDERLLQLVKKAGLDSLLSQREDKDGQNDKALKNEIKKS